MKPNNQLLRTLQGFTSRTGSAPYMINMSVAGENGEAGDTRGQVLSGHD